MAEGPRKKLGQGSVRSCRYKRLNGYESRVRVLKKCRADGKEVSGYHIEKTGEIVINATATPDSQRQFLFHELLHECSRPVRPVEGCSFTECIVTTIEVNMWQLLEQNPHLIGMLFPQEKS